MKHLSSYSTILIIVAIVVIFFIVFQSTAEDNSSLAGGPKVLNITPVPSPNNLTPGRSIPPAQGGNVKHLAKFNLTVALEQASPLRDNNVTINITFENKDVLKKSLVVQYINIDLLPGFKITGIHSNDTYDKSSQNRIRIPQFSARRDNPKSFRYDIYIPKNTPLNTTSLIDHDDFNKTDLSEIITIKRCRIDKQSRQFIHLNDFLNLQNNQPEIDKVKVSINASQLSPMNRKTLLVAVNRGEPLSAMFNISAKDVEEELGLKYGYFLTRLEESEYKNYQIFDEMSSCGDFSREIIMQPGVIYSLWAVVCDSDNGTTKKQAVINYNGNNYIALLIPDENVLDYSALILTLILTVIITIIIFHRTNYCSRKVLTSKRVIIIIILTWLAYCILTWMVSLTKVSALDAYLFFNTMQHFELAVYITEFTIITSFIEACFFLDDLIDFHDKALWTNYVLSFIILIIFIFFIPNASNKLSLSDYYVTMSTLMGTIFALVVTLSTQFPKNIFTSPPVRCSRDNVPMTYVDGYREDDEIFSYPKKLRYFVKLYGAALVISLLGLVIGTDADFGTKMLNLSQSHPLNLVSVAIFETTFLLIPPTVISLYHLMDVISFRGKITIRSTPSGAMVFLSKNREDKSIPLLMEAKKFLDRFFTIDREACIIDEPHCLNLRTPCTLMLMRGMYNLKLQKDSENMDPVPIRIRDAVEFEIMIDLAEKNSDKVRE